MGAPAVFKGRSLGLVILVAVQVLIGFIHAAFGFWLLLAPRVVPFFGNTPSPDVYSTYTIIFGLLTLIFAVGLWLIKRWSWIGTISVATFVIIADTLTLLNLPIIPGIPKLAGFLEISYSLLVIVYLLQPHVRASFRIKLNEMHSQNLK